MRKRKQQSSTSLPVKRRRGTNLPAFGAPSGDDSPLLQPSQIPSASALSTRVLPSKGAIPSLSSLAARSFVTHLQVLTRNEETWDHTKRWLKLLPDMLVPKLFSMLRSACPAVLSHGFIVLYFLRGPSLALSVDLPGVQRQTIASIAKNNALRELHLTGFDKFADTVFASLVHSLPGLRILVLRGCSKVGAKTAEAMGDACPLLTTINLNYTSVSPVSLVKVLTSCIDLEVLKVAGIPNWTDASFAKLLAGLAREPDLALRNMRNIKFRQLGLSETSIYPFISRCPNLKRLDISFTRVHRIPSSTTAFVPSLEKLSLTSTMISCTDVVSLTAALPKLQMLYLGALGGGQGSSASMGNINISAMTMTDETLKALTDIIENFDDLEKVSLVGNTKLGLTSRGHGALSNFICRVGRKCKHLNLSGIPYLRSQDLSGLMSETMDEGPPRVEELILNHTGIDDEAAPFLSCCSSLVTLEVAGTKLTSSGVFSIIDACVRLEKLDLTSCRGIKVADRRRFFEVWESEWKDA
ncbi:RNI-like protein [Gyrodon lividus]|nr:RNI-like protein [Gyrodon lividus]